MQKSITSVLLLLFWFSSVANSQQLKDLGPLDFPDHDHEKYKVEPAEHTEFLGAYVASFDLEDADTGVEDGPALLGLPSWVSYQLNAGSSIGAASEPSSWIAVPDLPNDVDSPTDDSYKGSCYSRGHMCMRDHAHRLGSDANYNTFCVINACPQKQRFNAGHWLGLEYLCGIWADEYEEIWITCGPIFDEGRIVDQIGGKEEVRVAIPHHFFKIVSRENDADPNQPHVLAFIYPHAEILNDRKPTVDHSKFLVSVNEIEERTGLNFFSNLPSSDQESIEQQAQNETWEWDFDDNFRRTIARVMRGESGQADLLEDMNLIRGETDLRMLNKRGIKMEKFNRSPLRLLNCQDSNGSDPLNNFGLMNDPDANDGFMNRFRRRADDTMLPIEALINPSAMSNDISNKRLSGMVDKATQEWLERNFGDLKDEKLEETKPTDTPSSLEDLKNELDFLRKEVQKLKLQKALRERGLNLDDTGLRESSAVDDLAIERDSAAPDDAETASGEMIVHFIDVGQGDATLIEFPNGCMLVDAGGEYSEDFDGASNLFKYLKEFFERRTDLGSRDYPIDLLAITHPHKDHTRAIPRILEDFTPRNIIHNHQRTGSGAREQKEAIEWIRETEINGYYIVADRAIQSGSGITNRVIDPFPADSTGVDPLVTVLWGGIRNDRGWDYGDFDNENNHSLVIRVDYGESSILFTGDLEESVANQDSRFNKAGIERLVQAYRGTGMLDADVYQAGHHGSYNGGSLDLLNLVSPELAVISCGPPVRRRGSFNAFNFGHPRKETIDELEATVSSSRPQKEVKYFKRIKRPLDKTISKGIYCTGWDGTIVLAGDANGNWDVKDLKGNPAFDGLMENN
jgi:competence protein ComEC